MFFEIKLIYKNIHVLLKIIYFIFERFSKSEQNWYLKNYFWTILKGE